MDKDGRTAFHYTIFSGADVNIRTKYEESPLPLAASKGYTETVECLLKYDDDVNIRNN